MELPGLPNANIGPDGEADFKGVSAQYRGKAIRVLPEVEGYEHQWVVPTVDGDTLTITLEREHPMTSLTGTLVPAPPSKRKIKVTVESQDGVAMPDELGRFQLALSGKPGDRVRIRVYRDDKLIYDDFQTLPGPVTLAVH